MKPYIVIRWLGCDEYHAHSDSCCYLRAMRWHADLNQRAILSWHGTLEEAQEAIKA